MANAILVVAEQLNGAISEITFEMLGVGRQLADAQQVPLTALLMGEGAAALAPKLGMADRVFVLENPQLNLPAPGAAAAVLKSHLEQNPADIILVGATNVSLGIGTALAARIQMPFVHFCKAVKCEAGSLAFTSQLFGGKILADVRLPNNRGIVSLYPGAFQASAGHREAAPPVVPLSLPVPTPTVTFQRYVVPETGDIDITKQSVLVAVGRGIQSQDNLALAEELAQVLQGAVCASRPVIDQGWLPLSRQVGKSGMNVKPRLYLALGISGAPEHWEGMQGSQLIISVNTDAKAPIFDGSHYGATADVLDLIPLLSEKVKAKKG